LKQPSKPTIPLFINRQVFICIPYGDKLFLVVGEAYQIIDQEMPHFLTFQVVGWADVFVRKVYRDFILENLTYCRNEWLKMIFS